MKIIISSDEHGHLVDVVMRELIGQAHEAVYIGPGPGRVKNWPDVTLEAASRVANSDADEAIVICWTGTGASIAANKVKGIRAALCHDAETAKGARIWNHANVLALSMRMTSEAMAKEILDAWLSTPYSEDEWNLDQIDCILSFEARGE